MPIRLRPMPKQPVWRVNTEQEPLDEMYDSFIGSAGKAATDIEGSKRGRDLLPEEVKVHTPSPENSHANSVADVGDSGSQ